MSHENKSKLLTKVSSLIEGQVPDFVIDDHPTFVAFLKNYFQFLEAGRITTEASGDYSNPVNYVRQETNTLEYVLLEDGERLVTEFGLGVLDASAGKFTNGETITGGTSNATATVLVEDSRNNYIYISSQQKFITGETITGGTSGATANISEYRANPIQNIQQLLEYADVDNTIYDFLDQMRESFMTAIPSTLATNTSKRNLLKNIKDLYSAKGTSEGHKLFMRLLLGEDANVIYPNEYMMRPSDGNWIVPLILRATASGGVDGNEIVNNTLTGQTSGATAIVKSALTIVQGSSSITEFQLIDVVGTFTDGETIKGLSNDLDVEVSFIVSSILSTGTITNDGVLYDVDEPIVVESLGNGFAAGIVSTIKTGGVSEIIIDDAGTGYEVGDPLVFTNPSSDTDIQSAEGFVSVVGGGFTQEVGTLDDSSVTTDTIILENNSTQFLDFPQIALEGSFEKDIFSGDGITRTFNLNNTSTLTDTLTLYIDEKKIEKTAKDGNAYWSVEDTPYLVLNASDGSETDAGDNILLEVDDAPQTGSVITLEQQTITFVELPIDRTPRKNARIEVRGDNVNYILLDGTDGSSFTNAGDYILSSEQLTVDSHTTSSDLIVLESDTLTASEANSIRRAYVSNSGRGYTDLPAVTITSTAGSDAELLASTTDIGAIDEIKITDPGLSLSSSNPPDLTPRAHFVVKDVTGTFASGNTLTTHEGTVKGWDSTTNVLDAEFENVVRIDSEQSGSVNQGIAFEDGTSITDDGIVHILLEGAVDDSSTSTDSIIFDGTDILTRAPSTNKFIVKVVENTLETSAVSTTDADLGQNIFSIDGKYGKEDFTAPELIFEKGDTYYFDLSDISLYNADSTENHELVFAELSDRLIGDGSTTTFTLKNSVVETPIAFVTKSSASFPANIRSHFDNAIASTTYTTSGNTITFTTAPSSGDHVIVFTKYTTGVTTSEDYVEIGKVYYRGFIQKGYDVFERAYIQIETTAETPDLYYYCVNHGARMGFAIKSKAIDSFIVNKGDNILLDGESIGNFRQNILLENGSQGTTLTTSHPGSFDVLLETGHKVLISSNLNDYRRTLFNFVRSGKAVKKSDGTLNFSLKLISENGKEPILLNGTDSSGAGDAGDSILFEDAINQEDRDFHINDAFIQFLVKEDHDFTDVEDAGGTSVLTLEEPDNKGNIFRIVLDGTDGSSTNAGESILTELKSEVLVQEKYYSLGTRTPSSKIELETFFPSFQGRINAIQNHFNLNTSVLSVLRQALFRTRFFKENNIIQHIGDKITLETNRTSDTELSHILLNGTDSSATNAGSKIISEASSNSHDFATIGSRIILNGTDSDGSDAGSGLLYENEDVSFEEIVIDSSDSSSTDAGDNLVLETGIDFSNSDVTITDSGGATATIVKADIATLTSTVDTIADTGKNYSGIESLLGENLNRIQDSYYYQDFSYEIQVGQSLSTYLNELKRAVHPTGFLPFGKVSIASSISAAISTTATGVSDYTGDDTFSPILASVLEALFSQVIQSRLQAKTTPSDRDNKIVLENGVITSDKLVLDATSSSVGTTIPSGTSVTLESSLQPSGYDYDVALLLLEDYDDNGQVDLETGSFENEYENILLETGDGLDLEIGVLESILYESGIAADTNNTTAYSYDGGGRLMSEDSFAPSDTYDRVLVKQIVTKVSTRPNPRTSRNLLLYLAQNPFGSVDSVQLESTTEEGDYLTLDGTLPFQYPDAFLRMEGTSGVDNLVLNGTDSSSTNAGSDVILESGYKIQLEYTTFVNASETERTLLENSYDGTGRLQMEANVWSFTTGYKINENQRIVLEDERQFVETIPLSEIGSFRFEDIRKTDKLILGTDPSKFDGNELGGTIRLDGTDSFRANYGDDILLEDNTDGSPLVTGDKLKLEEGLKFVINVDQNNANAAENTGILMENFGQLLLDGTDSSSSNAGHYIAQETTKNNRFTLEETGSLIVEDYSTYSKVDFLKSENLNDDILLEDIHRTSIMFGIRLEQDSYNQDVLLLDGTDSDSANAGMAIDLEDHFGIIETPYIHLESTNLIANEGQIPLDNWTLNSSTNPIAYQPIVHASEIRVRTTGDIALEDSTDTTYGYLVLNGTDGSLTNAGNNIDCEGGTGISR